MPKFKAFSLLETAITLAILGLLTSIIFPIYKIISHYKEKITNEEKYNYIRTSMQSYLLRHGKLPFAADQEGISKPNMLIGFIPYKTLGIKKSYMFDAKNNFFTYAVNKNFTNTNIPIITSLKTPPLANTKTFCRLYKFHNNEIILYDDIEENLSLFEEEKNIILQDDYFYIMLPQKKFKSIHEMNQWLKDSLEKKEEKYKNKNAIAWILISHGKNKTSCSQMNKIQSPKFCLLPNKNEQQNFSDQVFYQTRFDMAAQVGTPCTSEPIYE